MAEGWDGGPGETELPQIWSPSQRQGIPAGGARQGGVGGTAEGPVPCALSLTVFEGGRLASKIDLRSFGKTRLTFGAAPDNDVVIASSAGIVSRHHGTIELRGGECFVIDAGSTNGIFINGVRRESGLLGFSDVMMIGKRGDMRYDPITFLLSYGDVSWREYDLAGKSRVAIGRARDNDLIIADPALSAHHAVLSGGAGAWSLSDCGSYNGTFVKGAAVSGVLPLSPGDVIAAANVLMLFAGPKLYYTTASQGVDVLARDLVQVRRTRSGSRVTTDHVSLHIKKGEFVAIVGGSGSGKSTLLGALNGSDPASSGTVMVNGIDLYANYGVLKNAVGYVPQDDIVYDSLTLREMLRYAAKLRMPPDTTAAERKARADAVIAQLELEGEADSLIKRLSGGQRKRASIAVEMLADPKLFFLDEPTSGLDPGIEQSLMRSLQRMARGGRTIVVVTHTTLNLHLCDKVVFMGPGGLLCYAGPPQGALEFFGVDDFVDIYNLVAAQPAGWAGRFAAERADAAGGLGAAGTPGAGASADTRERLTRKSPSFISQLATLSKRSVRLLANDKPRLALLLLQAPLLAALISLVAGENCFTIYEDTKSCLFALACAAFWVGILNSIQEVCKERTILKREYAGGVKILPYVLSKMVVLGALCVVQSALLVGVFVGLSGAPDGALTNEVAELFITVFLTTLSAMALGLVISALFKNPDRAIAVAPILIMPQILFSGLIFKLEGIAENISLFVNCRWSMEAFGTTADLNGLDYAIYENDLITPELYPHEWEAAFEFTLTHLTSAWAVLGVFTVVCALACGLILRSNIRK